MAEYLAESTVPDEAMALADYYVRGIERVEAEGTAAIPRADMTPAVAAALGRDATWGTAPAPKTQLPDWPGCKF